MQNFSINSMIGIYNYFYKTTEPPRNIIFFGGEPLIMKGLICDFVNYIKTLHIKDGTLPPRFSIITNASLLDSQMQNFISYNFDAITFSIDGIREIHDRYRLDRYGNGTFQNVISNIEHFQQVNKIAKVAVEVTITDAYAIEYSPDLTLKTWNLIRELAISIIDYIPVQGYQYSLFEYCIKNKYDYSKRIINELVDLWFSDFIKLELITDVLSFRNLLISLLRKTSKNNACSAGKSYFAFTPNLDVYVCQAALYNGDSPRWRFTDSFILKTINGGFIKKNNNQHEFCVGCDCSNGCSCYCYAQWEINVPDKLPDICKFHRIARKRILYNIDTLYKNGEQHSLKKAVQAYYGR